MAQTTKSKMGYLPIIAGAIVASVTFFSIWLLLTLSGGMELLRIFGQETVFLWSMGGLSLIGGILVMIVAFVLLEFTT